MKILRLLLAVPLLLLAEDPTWKDEIRRARQLQQAAYYTEAESILNRAIETSPDGYPRARTLTALGSVYQDLGRFADAERSYVRAIRASQETIEPISGLSSLYFETGQYAKAEKLTRQCLARIEQDNSADRLQLAQQIGNLGALYQSEHKYAEAEKLHLKAIDLFERNGGTNTPEYAFVLHNLATLRVAAGKPEQATGYAERALAIWEVTLGPAHPIYAQGLADLALANSLLGHYQAAEALWNSSLSIIEKTLGPTHPTYGRLLRTYADSLDRSHHKAEARRFRRRADSIQAPQYTVDYRVLQQR